MCRALFLLGSSYAAVQTCECSVHPLGYPLRGGSGRVVQFSATQTGSGGAKEASPPSLG